MENLRCALADWVVITPYYLEWILSYSSCDVIWNTIIILRKLPLSFAVLKFCGTGPVYLAADASTLGSLIIQWLSRYNADILSGDYVLMVVSTNVIIYSIPNCESPFTNVQYVSLINRLESEYILDYHKLDVHAIRSESLSVLPSETLLTYDKTHPSSV